MTLTQHPLSAAFPAMSEEDYAALRDDIEDHGQREPIIVYEGMVLDGWHRYRACMDLGLKPTQFTFGDDDPVAFVLSHNLKRRHLSASQRAAAVVACAQWAPTGRPKKAEAASAFSKTSDLAKAAGTTDRTVRDAKVAHKAGLGDAVKEGALTAEQAAAIARGKSPNEKAAKKAATPPPAPTASSPPPTTKATPAEFADVDVDAAMSDIDPMDEIKRLQADNRHLEERVKALQASDLAAELAKQVQIRQGIEGRLNFEMEKVNQLQRELDSYGKWYAELRKITGKDRRSEITRIVREAREAA